MLETLTAHLLQTNKLHIPYVGTFRVENQPAVLHFADRLLYPPQSKIIFEATTDSDRTDPDFMAGENLSEDTMTAFGQKLRNRLATGPVIWSGVGTLELTGNQIFYHPHHTHGLLPVPANKVLRENRQHAILVGDQQHSSADISFMEEGVNKKKTWLWVGWLLLLIALLLIGWILYKEGAPFGSKIRVRTAWQVAVQQSYFS